MNQSELTARVAEAEVQLGQPLPADYRAFLLDDANEDKFTGDYLLFDSMICEFFLDPGAYTREDPDWTQDFPFTPENPLIADVPESFYVRLDNAATAAEYDAITEEQIDYLQKNFDEPALRGMAFLSDDGCNIYTPPLFCADPPGAKYGGMKSPWIMPTYNPIGIPSPGNCSRSMIGSILSSTVIC